MNIIIVTVRGPTNLNRRGGSQDYIVNIAAPWVNLGHEVTIISGQELLDGNELPSEEVVRGISVRRVGTSKTRAFPLMKAVRDAEEYADIIIENIMGFPLMLPLVLREPDKLIALKHHFEGINFIHSQGLLKGGYGLFLENILQPLIYRDSAFVVVSRKTERELIGKWVKPKGARSIIPPGIDTGALPLDRLPSRSSRPTILYLGALDVSRKRVDHLIDAFKVVLRSIPDAKLIIGGRGPDGALLEKLAAGLPVEFLGFVSDEHKARVMAESWVFASPSMSEGFGITWVEANAYGLPVIAYDLGLDTVDDSCSRMVELGNVSALSSVIIELLSNVSLRKELEKGAYENARCYDWASSSEKFLGFISGRFLKMTD